MWCTKICLNSTDIGVELVANSLRHLGLSKILLTDDRLPSLYLLLCFCWQVRFILLVPDLLDNGNYELFPLFLVASPTMIGVMLAMRGMQKDCSSEDWIRVVSQLVVLRLSPRILVCHGQRISDTSRSYGLVQACLNLL